MPVQANFPTVDVVALQRAGPVAAPLAMIATLTVWLLIQPLPLIVSALPPGPELPLSAMEGLTVNVAFAVRWLVVPVTVPVHRP